MKITRVVKMTFKEECIETFESIFEQRKQSIRSYNGCLHLELWQDRLHPNIFFTHSQWASSEHLDAYRHSPFFEETWKLTKVLFSDKPEAWTVEVKSVVEI